MKISETLKKVKYLLENQKISYALAGGLTSNLYRNEMRLTSDVDIAVISDLTDDTILRQVMHELNLGFGEVTQGELRKIPFPRKRLKSPIQIIVGRNKADPLLIGVDFLLKSLPWVEEAVERAQHNIVKILDDSFPCLTIEDMILSKLYTLKNEIRYKDLDDLEQFLGSPQRIDKIYLSARMLKRKLPIPKEIRKKMKIDNELGRVSREIEREIKSNIK